MIAVLSNFPARLPVMPSDPFLGAVDSPAAGSPDAGHGWADPLLTR